MKNFKQLMTLIVEDLGPYHVHNSETGNKLKSFRTPEAAKDYANTSHMATRDETPEHFQVKDSEGKVLHDTKNLKLKSAGKEFNVHDSDTGKIVGSHPSLEGATSHANEKHTEAVKSSSNLGLKLVPAMPRVEISDPKTGEKTLRPAPSAPASSIIGQGTKHFHVTDASNPSKILHSTSHIPHEKMSIGPQGTPDVKIGSYMGGTPSTSTSPAYRTGFAGPKEEGSGTFQVHTSRFTEPPPGKLRQVHTHGEGENKTTEFKSKTAATIHAIKLHKTSSGAEHFDVVDPTTNKVHYTTHKHKAGPLFYNIGREAPKTEPRVEPPETTTVGGEKTKIATTIKDTKITGTGGTEYHRELGVKTGELNATGKELHTMGKVRTTQGVKSDFLGKTFSGVKKTEPFLKGKAYQVSNFGRELIPGTGIKSAYKFHTPQKDEYGKEYTHWDPVSGHKWTGTPSEPKEKVQAWKDENNPFKVHTASGKHIATFGDPSYAKDIANQMYTRRKEEHRIKQIHNAVNKVKEKIPAPEHYVVKNAKEDIIHHTDRNFIKPTSKEGAHTFSLKAPAGSQGGAFVRRTGSETGNPRLKTFPSEKAGGMGGPAPGIPTHVGRAKKLEAGISSPTIKQKAMGALKKRGVGV